MKRIYATALALLLTACGGGSGESSQQPTPPVAPGSTSSTRELWRSNMIQRGAQLCDAGTIFDLGTWEGNVWYYDGMRVFHQIAEYTGDPSWFRCSDYIRAVYREYVLDNDGRVPGWRVFPQGLQLDFERTGEASSRTAALALAENSAFAASGGGADPELSRETAYLIHAYLTEAELGGGENPRLPSAVDFALGHLDAWTLSQSTAYVKPFMAGLTFEALIRYYEGRGRDIRILNTVQGAADWLWENGWDENAQAFEYILCRPGAAEYPSECSGPDVGPAPDLNLLIAPAYAWLYSETKDPIYRERAEAIFAGGVRGADLAGGKQFSQNYRWSFALVRWLGP